jgi:hypothetical protein
VIFARGEKAIEFGRVAEMIDMAGGAGVSLRSPNGQLSNPALGQDRAANAIIEG